LSGCRSLADENPVRHLENITAMMVFALVVDTLSFTEAANSLSLLKSVA